MIAGFGIEERHRIRERSEHRRTRCSVARQPGQLRHSIATHTSETQEESDWSILFAHRHLCFRVCAAVWIQDLQILHL